MPEVTDVEDRFILSKQSVDFKVLLDLRRDCLNALVYLSVANQMKVDLTLEMWVIRLILFLLIRFLFRHLNVTEEIGGFFELTLLVVID